MKALKHFFADLKPERFFIACAVVFGITFLLVTPPFQTPDEFNHFYRAYQISEGNLTAIKKDNRVGGDLPISLVKISEPFRALLRRGFLTTRWSTIAEQSNVALRAEERIFIDFPNTGMYSPVSYFPQALSIAVLRSCDISPIYIFYGARLFTLFFWIFCMTFIIRRLTIYQWLFTLLALLPMSISTHMSLSADVMTNLLAFAVIAYSFDLAYRQHLFSTRQIIVFTALAVSLALAKVVYLPLILFFFLIPREKFLSKFYYYKYLLVLFGFSFATALTWSVLMKSLYVPYNLYNAAFKNTPIMHTCISSCANMQEQLQYILSHGWYVVKVFFYSFYYAFDMYSRGFIGTFGWLDTYMATWTVVLAYGVIFLAAIGSGSKNIITGWRFKFLLVLVFFATMALILLSQLLTWSCIGDEYVYLIQGRYLIPVLPLLFMLFYVPQWHIPSWILSLVISVVTCFVLIYSSVLVWDRYFNEDEVVITSLSCDAEQVIDQNYSATGTLASTLENGKTRSSEKAHSGKYSAKISFKDPYTYTHRISQCSSGDSILVDVMRWGTAGGIMISADDNSFFYNYTDEAIEKDSAGWNHLQAKFCVPHAMNEEKVSIFMYYKEGNDSSYFDDLNIVYRKLK